jgi:single-strand DNA-binding protein
MNARAPTEPDRSQFQVINLTGRLTADPDLRTNDKGSVASLRLAVQRPRKDGEDQGADYVDITVFGRQADTVAQYLAKGRKVAVEGRLHHSEWESDNGRRQKLEVIARNVEFLDPRKSNDSDANGAGVEEAADTPAAF